MNDKTAIKVTSLYKTFKLPHEKHSSLKSVFVNIFKRKRTYEKQDVLKNIGFEVRHGEFFGIVGRNGSGKSTLLKLLAGIYTADSGSIDINGKLTPFIELGVGFSPELTGRENVFLNGALLGFSRKEMQKMYEDIVNFAELERFMDQKLKNYSSGMQVRLAFSIAIRARSDILLLDEVLAVGDESFQRKCYGYFEELKRNKKTVILVTHDMSAVEKYCDRAILIESGIIKSEGSAENIAQAYRNIFLKKEVGNTQPAINTGTISKLKFYLIQKGKKTKNIKWGSSFTIGLEFISEQMSGPAAIGFNIVNSQGHVVLSFGRGGLNEDAFEIKSGLNVIEFNIMNILGNDEFRLDATLESYTGSLSKVLYQKTNVLTFISHGVSQRTHALVQLDINSKHKSN